MTNTLQRRHYEAIAQQMRMLTTAHTHEHIRFVERVATVVGPLNANFNRERFIAACLPKQENNNDE